MCGEVLSEQINSVADVEFLIDEEIKVTNANLSIVSDFLNNSETESSLYVSRIISKIN